MNIYINSFSAFEIMIGIIILLIYITSSIVMNEYHKVFYKEKTLLAFIPIINFYILGKLFYNKLLGILMLVWFFIIVGINIHINGEVYSFDIFSNNLKIIFGILYIIDFLVMYSVIIYRLHKNK